MLFPDYLVPFREAAEKIYDEKNDFEVIFSGPTYQILCAPDSWVFVQFDQHSRVKDIFCQCEECSEKNACIHMALALVIIFKKTHTLPLHKRFEKSPFFSSFPLLSKKIFPCEIHNNSSLEIGSKKAKVTITGPLLWRKNIFKNIVCQEATEETSIKFSDLSEEEIENWRKGLFSDRLKFELSPFAEVAKTLFLFSEKNRCSYTISWDKNNPEITFSWSDRSCSLPLFSEDHLASILDTLPSQETTPLIQEFGGLCIDDIVFDEKRKTLSLFFSGEKNTDGEKIGTSHWSYAPTQGFIKHFPETKKKEFFTPQDIETFLNTYGTILSQKKLSTPVSIDPQALQYSVKVDERKGITITPFLKKASDLNDALFFNSWCWTKKSGFFRPFSFRFSSQNIPPEEIDDFLTHNRNWMTTLGFSVHDHTAKATITFHVDETGTLSFSTKPSETKLQKCVNLGSWVFIEGDGFFLQEGISVFPKEPIVPHRVAEFIRQHAELLREVPGFFSEKNPIHGIELLISYAKKNVYVSSHYQWSDPEYERNAFFYDDFVYVPELGFFQISPTLAQQYINRSFSPSDKDSWNNFFLEQLPRLKKELSCTIDPCLEQPKTLTLVCQHLSKPEELKALRLEGVWDASFVWESEKGSVSCSEAFKSYLKGERFYISKAGLLDLSDDRFGWFSSVPLSKHGDLHRLQNTDILKIKAHEDFSFDEKISTNTVRLIEKVLNCLPVTPPPYLAMHEQLRPYQKRGLDWLWYLYTNGLSGLLCDDMGVGKTHQAMALLGSIAESARQEGKKPFFLVLCPTSLFWHWKEKLEGALPHLQVFPYTGTTRSLDTFSAKTPIFLTTYGIWRSEVAELKKITFEAAIFDELQIAKNHVSLIWAALSQVKAPMYLGLTGTPIENSLRELKAIFDLILPGYLPRSPSNKDLAPQKKDLLSRYVRPFILRRRKQDVLSDLPLKTEEIYTTTLIGEQKELYKQVAARQSTSIVQQLQDESAPIPYMHIFALLSALKQICNHPAAYLRDVENYQRYESGKWDAFTELLEEARESNQKVIVFSHYLAMLDIMALHLHSKKICFAEIRGSTKNRGESIDRFQKDPKCTVFLGSLHAAGLGIDLTAGSVVIHYDRWWNAAREDQATDRAHRIGQTRGVMVYKLLTAATVEERIDELISKKAQLFEDIIKFDDHRIMKQFNRQELLHLLRNIEE